MKTTLKDPYDKFIKPNTKLGYISIDDLPTRAVSKDRSSCAHKLHDPSFLKHPQLKSKC